MKELRRKKPARYAGTVPRAPTTQELVQWGDNLTNVAPWGDLVVCEDIPVYLFGVTPEGNVYKLGRNVGFKSESDGLRILSSAPPCS